MDTSRSGLLRNDIKAQLHYGFREEEIICNLKTKGYSEDDILAEKDLFLNATEVEFAKKHLSVPAKMMLVFSLLCIVKGIWGMFFVPAPHSFLIMSIGVLALTAHFQGTRWVLSVK